VTDPARRRWLATAPLLLLGACAQVPRVPAPTAGAREHWSGRIALRIDSEPAQSFAAGFDLRGNAQRGELALYSPLGATLARLQWSVGTAELAWNGQRRSFDSIDALTRQAVGTELPIASLFNWLSGQDSHAEGWSADLGGLGEGKLVAQRTAPAPAVTLRLVLD